MHEVFLGIDVGSSFLKMVLIDSQSTLLQFRKYPQNELEIQSLQPNWAEQDPDVWWNCVQNGLQQFFPCNHKYKLKGIGISYQMHGLVVVDSSLRPLRKSIIWCDGRTVQIGKELFLKMKEKGLEEQVLNHPSNFTLSKLVWLQKNQPEIFQQIYKFILPGDYIAMKISGQCCTSETAISEGIMWDFTHHRISDEILQLANISKDLIPKIVANFSLQSYSHEEFNKKYGFKEKIPICYRSGDQPNNAYSLGVLEPGNLAATAGTSGVIYVVTDQIQSKEKLKFNSFLHVNSRENKLRIGKLLCINGCGKVYSWIKTNFVPHWSYEQMNEAAESIAETDVLILPFGNGLERMLDNQQTKCQILYLDFNRHQMKDIIRSAVESIAFSFAYGAQLMKNEGIPVDVVKAGKGNLFDCKLFCEILATLMKVEVEVYNTTGAVGCARAALETIKGNVENKIGKAEEIWKPNPDKEQYLLTKYEKWKKELKNCLKKQSQ